MGYGDRDSPPVASILEILEIQEAVQRAHPELDAAVWETSKRAADTVLTWNVAPVVAVAALLAPLIEFDMLAVGALAAQYGREAVDLAGRLLAWRESRPAGDGGREPLAVHYARRLRGLFRETYLDAPGLPFILLLLADHDARLHDPTLGTSRLAEETDAVHLPLAIMLGLWHLRRRWIDRSMALQFPHDYRVLEAGWVEQERQTKTRVYGRLAPRLIAQAQAAGLVPLPEVKLDQPSLGTTLQRRKRGISAEELAGRLTVRVLCATAADCYRMLGVIHSLGKPVTPRFTERFADFIAAPQLTGYRALHTAITYPDLGGPAGGTGGHLLVEFRILTTEMDTLNEWGVIAACHRHPAEYGGAAAWWNRLSDLTQRLRHHRRAAEALTIGQFLAAADLDTRSDPLYVFTPRGEIVLLADGSGPIDFAYHIHTDLSRHVAKVEVNRQEVPVNYPLRNGDLVQVQYDPQVTGPDLSWLGFVTTARARATIRRGLVRQAQSIHPGRSKIQDLLIKSVQYYAREKGYALTLTNRRLDEFLLQMAQVLRLGTLATLYAEVEAGRLSPDHLVRRLISAELAMAVVDAAGERLPYPLHRIVLCGQCRPVPGDPLVALERHGGTPHKRLILHTHGNRKCPGAGLADPAIGVRWASGPGTAHRELALFEIAGDDRFQLLEDVLDAVYREPGAILYRVEAQAYPDGSANITLAVEAASLAALAEIRAHIGAVDNVRQVLAGPPSPAQRLALQSPGSHPPPNPYGVQEVYDRWMFYDREEPISRIQSWLARPSPTHPLILHGQRRVGKSSLARYLMNEVLPAEGVVLPVFVDLQGLSGFGPQNLADYFVRKVYAALQTEAPEPARGEEPMHWLDRALAAAVARLGGDRLLILVDEFNALLEMEDCGRLDPQVFVNLRAVLNERRDVYWLLIVQDIHFRDPERWGRASALFDQTITVGLQPLDFPWARKLIVEPLRRCGLDYAEESLPQRIWELTAGSPYLIQILCYHLVEFVRQQNRMYITPADLKWVVDVVQSDGRRYFAHFTVSLTGARRMVLAAVAALAGPGESLAVADLTTHLAAKARKFDALGIRHALDSLERQGMLALREHDGIAHIAIPMQLFHAWVKRTVDLGEAVDDWRATRLTDKR